MKKELKTALKCAGAVTAAAAGAYLLLGDTIYKTVLTRMGVESPLMMRFTWPDGTEDDYTKYLNSVIDEGVAWFDNKDKKNFIIKSTRADHMLHANYLTPDEKSDMCAIVIHGYSSYPSYMGAYVKKYLEMGFNVLTPSLRGHGESEEEKITMGWYDRFDIIDWINFLIEKNPNVKIVLHGVSMGASAAMMTTGEKIPKNVIAAVCDCGFTTVWDMFKIKIENSMNLPSFPALNSLNTANKIHSGFDFKKASSIEQLKKSVTPTLFIHGEGDDFVPPEMMDKLFDACNAEKEKLLVPKAIHARSAAAEPELYWNTVFDFIERYCENPKE